MELADEDHLREERESLGGAQLRRVRHFVHPQVDLAGANAAGRERVEEPELAPDDHHVELAAGIERRVVLPLDAVVNACAIAGVA